MSTRWSAATDCGKLDLPLDARRWLGFVQLESFPQAWKRIGLVDDDLRDLEHAIMERPNSAPVVAGTGGVRKMRFAPRLWRRGKSGSVRAYYAFFPEHGIVALVAAHDKEELVTITDQQKRQVKVLLDEVRAYLDLRTRKGASR